MALQISLSTPSAHSQPSLSPPASKPISQSSVFSVLPAGTRLKISSLGWKRRSCGFGAVRCSSLEAAAAAATVGQVTDVNKDSFWPIVEAAGDKTVVLDMYTQWCGPCKIMAPKFQALSEKYLDVIFLKLDCNQENKSLAKELGMRVVPTFKILKHNKVVKEVTGAKYDDLVFAIETVRSS